jgi:predicted ATPase
MTKLAELLVAIARNGTQVIAATHSLFMMRELSLLLGIIENKNVDRRFFALELTETGAKLTDGSSAEEIEPIVALEAEVDQSERYFKAQETQDTKASV